MTFEKKKNWRNTIKNESLSEFMSIKYVWKVNILQNVFDKIYSLSEEFWSILNISILTKKNPKNINEQKYKEKKTKNQGNFNQRPQKNVTCILYFFFYIGTYKKNT